MEREKKLNIPNLLSGYRLLIFPVVWYLISSGREDLFLLFMALNFVTDFLDGYLARRFNLQTSFGARLDSIADIGSYILAGYGLIQFKWHVLSTVGLWLWIFLLALMLPYVVSYIRFGKFPSLHLYSSKIGGTIDGIFLVSLFVFGFNNWLFTLAIGWGILSFIEMTSVLLLLSELKADCKGLYWVLKSPAQGSFNGC